MRLILVRHGETPWNEAGRYQGWEDTPLSPRGSITAKGIGVRLRARGVTRFHLWSSDLARAVATARIAFTRVPRIDPRLRELDFGEFAGRTYQENLDHFGSRFAAWVEHRGHPAPPGGEQLTDFFARTEAWLSDVRGIVPSGDTVVAVTHGGVVRALIRPFVDEELWPGNGELIVLRWNDGREIPVVERWNDPKEKK
ncbi:MAG: histidine phosphatase family protein [Gemmatimonadota bacterium]